MRDAVKRVVLDVLKPHEPSLVYMAKRLAKVKGVKEANLLVQAVDRETETLKITIDGNNIDLTRVRKTIEEMGGVIHSVDQVVAGKS